MLAGGVEECALDDVHRDFTQYNVHAPSLLSLQRCVPPQNQGSGLPDHNLVVQPDASQDQYEEADQLLKRALDIDEKSYGPQHPQVATDLNNLAALFYHQVKKPAVIDCNFPALLCACLPTSYGRRPWQVVQLL